MSGQRKIGHIAHIQQNFYTQDDHSNIVQMQKKPIGISKKKFKQSDQNPQKAHNYHKINKIHPNINKQPPPEIQTHQRHEPGDQTEELDAYNPQKIQNNQVQHKTTDHNKQNHRARQQQPHQQQHQRPELNVHDRFDTQILRVQVNQYCRIIEQMFYFPQTQLSEFMCTFEVLPHSPVNVQRLISSRNCKLIKTSDEKIYLGETQNKKKHGLGIALYRNNRAYQGSFVNNERQGLGVEVYSNSNLYIGNFRQNKRCGQGAFFWFCLSSVPCTESTEVAIEHYTGNWWGGLPDGQGQHYRANGDVYMGAFKNGLKHGKGLQYYFNGDLYQGLFVNGLSQGYGHYVWSNGSSYKGDFKQGYRNGYGIWTNARKNHTFKGHYMLNKKHGYGIQTWGNGYCFKGDYLNDQRSGGGILLYHTQVVFQGKWQKGQKIFLRKKSSKGQMKKLTQTASQTGKSFLKSSKLTNTPNFSHLRVDIKKPTNQSASRSKNVLNNLQSQKQAESNQKVIRNRRIMFTGSEKERTPKKRVSSTQDKFSFTVKRLEKNSYIGHRNCSACIEGCCKSRQNLSNKAVSTLKDKHNNKGQS